MEVVIVSKSYLCRQGIKQLLKEIEHKLVYETDNFDQLPESLLKYNPDIIVLETNKWEENLIDIVVSIKKIKPGIKFMLFCDNGITATVFNSIQSFFECIVNTNVSREEIILAIHSILNGEKYYTSSLIKLLISQRESKNENAHLSKIFTEREIQIINYILKGRSNEQIADILYLSEKTVATHKRNIMKKAQVKKTSDLILYALEKGFNKGKYA
jgi:DNA-binding NarL/FixJ family response regulator